MRIISLFGILLFLNSCSDNATNPESMKEPGTYQVEYDKDFIKEYKTSFNNIEVQYWDNEGYKRKKTVYYPTIWWQSYDTTLAEGIEISSYFSLNDNDYLFNETRKQWDGRYYTYWTKHQNYEEKKVWMRCELDNKVIFKCLFIIPEDTHQ